MFLGTHRPRLDGKGRLLLPAKYRDELAEGLTITKGQDRCLYVFTAPEFARITEALRIAPVTVKAVRYYCRILFASACDERPDGEGRVAIPLELREYAGLRNECVVIGADTRLEIWDAQAWEAYLAEQENAFSAVSGDVWPGRLPAHQPSVAPGSSVLGHVPFPRLGEPGHPQFSGPIG